MTDEREKLEFLLSKAISLKKEKDDAYEGYQRKAGTILAVVALFLPLLINNLLGQQVNCYFFPFVVLPFVFAAKALYHLMFVIKPNKLKSGLSFDRFEKLIKGDYLMALRDEISAIKTADKLNASIYSSQITNFKKAINAIMWTAGMVFLFIALLLITIQFNL